jgi:hypothetical protein
MSKRAGPPPLVSAGGGQYNPGHVAGAADISALMGGCS